MDSLDAQCHLIALADAEGCCPAQWCHESNGRLRLRFAEGSDDYSWDREAVAEIAARWHIVVDANDPDPSFESPPRRDASEIAS